jgi:hypothetical protein
MKSFVYSRSIQNVDALTKTIGIGTLCIVSSREDVDSHYPFFMAKLKSIDRANNGSIRMTMLFYQASNASDINLDGTETRTGDDDNDVMYDDENDERSTSSSSTIRARRDRTRNASAEAIKFNASGIDFSPGVCNWIPCDEYVSHFQKLILFTHVTLRDLKLSLADYATIMASVDGTLSSSVSTAPVSCPHSSSSSSSSSSTPSTPLVDNSVSAMMTLLESLAKRLDRMESVQDRSKVSRVATPPNSDPTSSLATRTLFASVPATTMPPTPSRTKSSSVTNGVSSGGLFGRLASASGFSGVNSLTNVVESDSEEDNEDDDARQGIGMSGIPQRTASTNSNKQSMVNSFLNGCVASDYSFADLLRQHTSAYASHVQYFKQNLSPIINDKRTRYEISRLTLLADIVYGNGDGIPTVQQLETIYELIARCIIGLQLADTNNDYTIIESLVGQQKVALPVDIISIINKSRVQSVKLEQRRNETAAGLGGVGKPKAKAHNFTYSNNNHNGNHSGNGNGNYNNNNRGGRGGFRGGPRGRGSYRGGAGNHDNGSNNNNNNNSNNAVSGTGVSSAART